MNRFSGDPAIKITEDGASMTFKGGQPEMDGGLENAVLISLLTKTGWWGNDLLKQNSQKIGSDYDKKRTIVELQTILDYQDAAKRALQWMKTVGLAENINITVTNPYNNQIKTKIIIIPPGQEAGELLLFKNTTNWINQTINPANERL